MTARGARRKSCTRPAPAAAGTVDAAADRGRFYEEPLTYLYSGYHTSKVKDGSRRKIRRECRREWGANYAKPVGAPTRHCDEYPFAGTYQNAALVDESSPYSFVVRVVNAAHNVKAGQILRCSALATTAAQRRASNGSPAVGRSTCIRPPGSSLLQPVPIGYHARLLGELLTTAGRLWCG